MPLIEARFCRACGVRYWPEAVSEDDAGLCPSCLHQGSEPEEGDYITTDHEHFYQHGKLALVVEEGDDWARALQAQMERERFWPDVWFLSDHGNAHRIDLNVALGAEEDDDDEA